MTEALKIIMPPTETIDDYFPKVNYPVKPLGNRVLVQIRLPKKKTASGLILTDDTKDFAQAEEQTGKVVGLGNGVFHYASNGEAWAIDAGYDVGSYVRVPRHGGDNHWVPNPNDTSELILFKTFRDHEVIAVIEGDPMNIKTVFARF